MKHIIRFLIIGFGPNSLLLLYVYIIGLTNKISSRTYDMRGEIVVQYLGSGGVSLFVVPQGGRACRLGWWGPAGGIFA